MSPPQTMTSDEKRRMTFILYEFETATKIHTKTSLRLCSISGLGARAVQLCRNCDISSPPDGV